MEGVDVAVGLRTAKGQAGNEEGVRAVRDMFLQQIRIDHHAKLRAGTVAERGETGHEIIEYETAVEERAIGIRGRLRPEKEHLLRAEETEVFPVVGAAFVGVVAADAFVFENPEPDFLGANLPGFGQRIWRILVAGFGWETGVESGEIVGAQCAQCGALHQKKFPRLGVLGARGATGSFHELADRFPSERAQARTRGWNGGRA